MSLLKLTLKRLFSRKVTSLLLILSIGLSTMLLVGVQKIKQSAKDSFSQSLSGTDLIVGARSGDTQLLLYTVFRQGQPIANMSWKSVKEIQTFPEISWVVPISLGDSHKGYPVLGTTLPYFKHYKYASKQPLKLKTGRLFQDVFEVVLGSEVAKHLNYKLNDRLFLAHGIAKGNLTLHKNYSFNVVGVLKPTGTPVDKTLHIPIEGFTALHIKGDKKTIKTYDLKPKSVTSCLIGLTSKISIFSVQKQIVNWKQEPLMAIIPGVTLSRLWDNIRTIDTAFFIITVLVTLITFIGLLLVLLISLQQSKRELAILRTLGAHPLQLSWLLILESLFITTSGVIFGLGLMNSLGYALKPFFEEKMGLILSFNMLTLPELYLALCIIFVGILTSSIPALLAYRKGLSEGFVSL